MATTAQDLTRRDAIAEYRLIGEPPEPDLEGLVELAATLCGVPTAVVNIIDDGYQHQVAAIGFAPSVCAREDSMCAAVFENPGHVVVPDSRIDPRFADNPFVTGEIAHVRFYASSPLVTPSGVPIGTLCVFDDVVRDLSPDESRGLALLAHQVVDVLELRRLARALRRANDELTHFAGQVSHDLSNPLTAISGYIEFATDDPELVNAPRAASALARAESSVDRMGSMIADLLDYARTGGALTRRVDVVLDDVVRMVVDDLDVALRETEAQVTSHAPVHLTGDGTLLRALVQNLVANAVKFAAAAGRAPRIEVHAQELSGGWRITVDDNGPGVAMADRERVFGAMERGDRSVPGLGLGLATCRRIVEAHDGRIGIADSPLGGASVWIVLPRTDA